MNFEINENILISEMSYKELIDYINKLKQYDNFNIDDEVLICIDKTKNYTYLAKIEGLKVAWSWSVSSYTFDDIGYCKLKVPLNELINSLHIYSNYIEI